MTPQFAPSYPRTDQGWIKFPRDKADRDKLFIPESYDHPAKANLYLIQSLVEYTTNPGDWIMDVTAGTGTILVAATTGRRVIAIELNPLYHEWIERNAQKMGVTGCMIFQADCRYLLPIECQSIIFSPPYSTTMKGGGGIHAREKSGEQYSQYQSLKGNLGDLQPFYYNVEMEKIYRLCYQSLTPGGTLSLIIKDFYEGGKLQQLGWRHIQQLNRCGFEVQDWFTWDAPGTQFKNIHRSQGHRVVEGEHIIVVRKEG